MVVVFAPCHEGLGQVGKQVLIQAFVPQAAIEAVDEAVLRRFSRRANRSDSTRGADQDLLLALKPNGVSNCFV